MTRPSRRLPLPLADLPVNFWLLEDVASPEQRQRDGETDRDRDTVGTRPVSLSRRLVETYSKPGDWLLDPLSGVGAIGEAAILMGRNYLGLEHRQRQIERQSVRLAAARQGGAYGRFALRQVHPRQLDRRLIASMQQSEVGAGPGCTGQVDVVITSPDMPGKLRADRHRSSQQPGLFDGLMRRRSPVRERPATITGSDFRREMRRVYGNCLKVLRPGGLLVVTAPSARDGHRLLPLHHLTAALCAELGFELIDEVVALRATLTMNPAGRTKIISHASFRERLEVATLRERGYPVTLCQTACVLVLQKPATAASEPLGIFRLPAPTRKSDLAVALAGPSPQPGG